MFYLIVFHPIAQNALKDDFDFATKRSVFPSAPRWAPPWGPGPPPSSSGGQGRPLQWGEHLPCVSSPTQGHVLGVLGDLRPAGRGRDITDVGSETEASGLISGVPVVCGMPGLTSLVCFASLLSGNSKWESEARRGDREKPPRRGAAGCVQGEGAGCLSVLRMVQGPSLLLMPPWAEAAPGRQKAAT